MDTKPPPPKAVVLLDIVGFRADAVAAVVGPYTFQVLPQFARYDSRTPLHLYDVHDIFLLVRCQQESE